MIFDDPTYVPVAIEIHDGMLELIMDAGTYIERMSPEDALELADALRDAAEAAC